MIIAFGLIAGGAALLDWPQSSWSLWLFLLFGAFLSALPIKQFVGAGPIGTLFVLLAIQELNLGGAMLVGCVITVVQLRTQTRAARVPGSLLFHLANMAVGIQLAYYFFHAPWYGARDSTVPLAIAAAMLYGWLNLTASVMVALHRGLRLASVLRECTVQTFPQYPTNSFLAIVIHRAHAAASVHLVWVLIPAGLLAYSIYASQCSRTHPDTAPDHDFENLHLRSLEALAMAIEARDLTSATHLRRLQLYCGEIGKELGLPSHELDALRMAVLLHDIGKLAIPEHILSKGGLLTREEFEAVKIHVDVGAEIVESIGFPYPVADIVRSHHERWNGTGYPRGLKAGEIPIGARILAVADTLDALLTHKPYRPALRLEEALDRLAAESGVHFDPRVIDVLLRRYAGLEERLRQSDATWVADDLHRLKEAFAPIRQSSPPPERVLDAEPAFLSRIAQSREEAQTLLEITQDLGKSLQLDESLPAVAKRLRKLIPFDSCVVYLLNEQTLAPRYAAGESTSLLMSIHQRLGQGAAGTAALSGKPVLNAPVHLESAAGSAARRALSSTGMAIPLSGAHSTAGVLLLTRRNPDGFTKDHLRVAIAIQAKLGAALENAVSYEQARQSASTDFLTGLPNARSLHQQLEAELARCRRASSSLTVLVTDLDGFKEVNDRFGHLDGNRVLQAVARALRHSCREYDYVARMGGDEFVFILPGLEEHDIPYKVVQLNRAVAEAARSVVPEARIGLSVGEARFPRDGHSAEELLLEADQRMYKVKTTRKLNRARNRGFVFDHEPFEILPADH
jgi:diguanylate cyclase (GGDEF)-like protein/putative nucleotidyltransferase with HDIG domain